MSEADKKRRERNQEILERMKDPDDSLSSFSSYNSHWPRRPPLAKDKDAMRELYLTLLEGK